MNTPNNELAELASKYADEVRPYAKKIVGVAIIVAVALLAAMFLRQRSQLNEERSWTSYFAAVGQSDLDGLYEVADTYPRTAAGAWALQSAGDINLATGTVNLYSDRAEARERLQTAQKNYQQARQQAADDLLKQRSLMGLAQVHEALNEFESAEEIYAQVTNTWPGTTIAQVASDRMAVLGNPETKQFYDWFMAQEVEPPKNPLGDLQLDLPSVYDDLPGDPKLSVPADDALERERELMLPPETGVDIEETEVEETEVPAAPDPAELEDTPASAPAPE